MTTRFQVVTHDFRENVSNDPRGYHDDAETAKADRRAAMVIRPDLSFLIEVVEIAEDDTRFQVSKDAGGIRVLAETDGPSNLGLTFIGETVILAIMDGDDETVVSIPRHVWDSLVEAGQ